MGYSKTLGEGRAQCFDRVALVEVSERWRLPMWTFAGQLDRVAAGALSYGELVTGVLRQGSYTARGACGQSGAKQNQRAGSHAV